MAKLTGAMSALPRNAASLIRYMNPISQNFQRQKLIRSWYSMRKDQERW